MWDCVKGVVEGQFLWIVKFEAKYPCLKAQSPLLSTSYKIDISPIMNACKMDWRTVLSQEIQQMRNNNNSRFQGGYTGPAIRDHEFENNRIDKYMKDKIDHYKTIEHKDLEDKAHRKNKYLTNILLALPSKDIQVILDKYPPAFLVEKVDYPGISTVKSSISEHMLTDLYEAFTKCLTSIKSNIPSQEDIDCADRIYNKSKVLESPNKTSYDHIISRAQALHYIYQVNHILELLIEKGIRHEYVDKWPTNPYPLHLYIKLGTKYLHVFIDSEIDRQVNNTIFPQNYGQWTNKEIYGIKHRAIHHVRTTTRINKLSKLEVKRQEQERIDAEVERRLKKEEFEKKVLARLQEKKKTVENTIVINNTIPNYIESVYKDISWLSSLGEL